jgi:hypothetical protein
MLVFRKHSMLFKYIKFGSFFTHDVIIGYLTIWINKISGYWQQQQKRTLHALLMSIDNSIKLTKFIIVLFKSNKGECGFG